MQRKYTVHSCAEEAIQVTAQYNGQDIVASVPGLIVELVSEDGGKAQTESYIPVDIEADKALFAVGNPITVTYSASE